MVLGLKKWIYKRTFKEGLRRLGRGILRMEKKILIIDDEKDFIEIVKSYLDKKSYLVDVAYDGKEALDLIKSKDYNVIFVDRCLGGLTGLELIQYVKENKLAAKIIMITGYPLMEGFLAKHAGADGYLEKPVSLEKIEKIIEES